MDDLSAHFALLLILIGSALGANSDLRDTSVVPASGTNIRQIAAEWLSMQSGHPVRAAQVLAAPSLLEGCGIVGTRATVTGATAISLRCASRSLPQLLLVAAPTPLAKQQSFCTRSNALPTPVIARGAKVRADWQTESMHATLDVVAIEPGAKGSEIRVRIARTTRIMRARVIDANLVSIIAAHA